MLIGAHVSIAGGIDKAPARAGELELEAFQIFTRSPQGGKAPELTPALVDSFHVECEKYAMKEWVVHTPYYINLANAQERIRNNSVRIIREELERASIIGARWVMTHIGSSKDVGHEKGLEYCIEGVRKIMEGYTGSAGFLLEIAAGSGHVIGGTYGDLATIINAVDADVNVCYDTQHGFAAGYDMRTEETWSACLDSFDALIGIEKLKIAHCNDSIVGFGEQKDRHEHIGEGEIGLDGFRAWFNDPRSADLNLYLETKHDDLISQDINHLKSLRT